MNIDPLGKSVNIYTKKTCGIKQHVWIDNIQEKPKLISGNLAVGERINSTRYNYGFEPYIRKAYSQSKNNNKNAIIDFFENKNRSTLEENVFKFIENTDKPETSETNKENNQEENDLKE